MKHTIISLFFLLSTVNCLIGFSANYYVAVNGNDNNNGSISAPFASFNKAVLVMQAGDVCIVRGGIYRQSLIITKNKNGTANKPLIFKAANNEKVIIKATNSVTNWSVHNGAIYKTNVAMLLGESNQVYYNNELMQIARWPNDTDGNRFTIDAKPVTEKGTLSQIKTKGIPNIDLTDAYVWYLGGHTGASWVRKPTSITQNTINFPALPEVWPYKPHNPTVFRKEGKYGRYYLFGTLSLLDQGNEWYYDKASQTLYFQTISGNIPPANSVEIPVRKSCIVINGDYVTIDGFETFGGDIQLRGSYNSLINSTIIHGKERIDEIPNNDAQISDGSIAVKADHAIVMNNRIEEGSINGIQLSNKADNSLIEKNIIKNFDAIGIHATAIRVTANNVRILKNEISHTGRDGMFVSGSNCEIAYNDISRAQLINDDSGVFYTVGNANNRNTEIHHNWIHDSFGPTYGAQKAAGIYLDNNSKGYLVHHNVIWNVSWSGIQLNWENWNNNIYHNTILNVDRAMGSWVNGHLQQNNRVWNNYSNSPDWLRSAAFNLKNNVLNSREILIEDIRTRNFSPKKDSPLVDEGTVITGFNKFSQGKSPDIGAYELNGSLWTAGLNAIEDVFKNTTSLSLESIENTTKLSNQIVVAPNPVKNSITIYGLDSSDILEIETYNLDGSLINSTSDLTFVEKGVYFLKIKTKTTSIIKKIIKE